LWRLQNLFGCQFDAIFLIPQNDSIRTTFVRDIVIGFADSAKIVALKDRLSRRVLSRLKYMKTMDNMRYRKIRDFRL